MLKTKTTLRELLPFGLLIATLAFSSKTLANDVSTNSVEFRDPAIMRIVSPKQFGLGDSLFIEADGSSPQLQSLTADSRRLILLIDSIPLRGMATNILLVTNVSLSTNVKTSSSIVLKTNVTSEGTEISHSRVEITNVIINGHLGTLRIQFRLGRSETNRAEWNQLLGSPTSFERDIHSLEIGLDVNSNGIPILAKAVAPESVKLVVLRNNPFFEKGTGRTISTVIGWLCVAGLLLRFFRKRSFGELFKSWSGWLWIGLLWASFALLGGIFSFFGFIVLFVAGFLYLANTTEVLRDSGPKPPNGKHRTYSLARFQMAVWFFLAAAAFVFLWMIADTLDTVTGTVLALMGIGAGTALGAEAQKASKWKDQIKDLEAKANRTLDENCQLRRLKILTLDVLCEEQKLKELQAAVQCIKDSKPEMDLNKRRTELLGIAAPSEPDKAELARIEDALKNWADLPSSEQKIKDIQDLLNARPVSRDFFTDILTDDSGISFHRFQMFVWTIILGIIFIFSVYKQLAMPQFNETLLALLGISSGTYLGFMFAENPGTKG